MRKPFTPRPYQPLIMEHIINHKRCAVWVFMGGGKTSSTLMALDALSLAEDVYPALVLAPLRVATTTWPDEVLTWNELKGVNVSPITGTLPQRLAAINMPAQIYTTNYEQVPWLIKHWGDAWPYKTVISDESTRLKGLRVSEQTSKKGKTFINGQGSTRAKALSQIAHTKINRFINLTGTPAPNGLQDTWGQTWFLDRGERLGRTFEGFKQRWFQRAYDGHGLTPLAHAQDEIQARLKDICLTIDAKDYFDLSAPIVTTVHIDLPPAVRKQYREMEIDMFTQIKAHDVEVFGAAARSIKCLQFASGSVIVDEAGNTETVHDEKIKALESIVEEWGGQPILVAYHFKSDLARLLKAFPQARQLDKSPQTIKDFNAGKIQMLLAHPQSAGHGLNLQHGTNVLVYFSHWWALEDRLQIAERIGPVRQMQAGLDRNVYHYHIVARDTVDEDVISRVDEKRTVQEVLLDAMKRRGVE